MLKIKKEDLAHNISYAVFRIARLVRHPKLRSEMECVAIELVKNTGTAQADSLIRIIQLAHAVGEINDINTDVLCRELVNLKGIIHAEATSFDSADPDSNINGMFGNINKEEVATNRPAPKTAKKDNVKQGPINNADLLKKQEDRQNELNNFIRQFPDGCRMKDLVDKFSYVSERTLRNDIQKLVQKDKIERFGSKSGPFSYLKAIYSVDGQEQERQIDQTGTSTPSEALFLPKSIGL
jgi:hypothetical protein